MSSKGGRAIFPHGNLSSELGHVVGVGRVSRYAGWRIGEEEEEFTCETSSG